MFSKCLEESGWRGFTVWYVSYLRYIPPEGHNKSWHLSSICQNKVCPVRESTTKDEWCLCTSVVTGSSPLWQRDKILNDFKCSSICGVSQRGRDHQEMGAFTPIGVWSYLSIKSPSSAECTTCSAIWWIVLHNSLSSVCSGAPLFDGHGWNYHNIMEERCIRVFLPLRPKDMYKSHLSTC